MERRRQSEIYDLLYQLGATENYIGFFHTAYAVALCAEQPERLLGVIKGLYPAVAKAYKTNWKAVERNIRTVRDMIWHKNRPLLEALARRHLTQRPRNTQLLAILTASLDSGPPAAQRSGQADAPACEFGCPN